MNKRTSKKLKRIISIVLVSTAVFLLIGGVSIYVIIHGYISKMNMIHTDVKQETDQYQTQRDTQEPAQVENQEAAPEQNQEIAMDEQVVNQEATPGQNQEIVMDEQVVTRGVIHDTSDYGNDSDQASVIGEDDLEVFSNYSEDQINITDGIAVDNDKEDVLSEEIAVLNQVINENVSNNQVIAENSDITNILLIGSDEENMDVAESSEGFLVISINHDRKKIVASTFLDDIYLHIPGFENDCLSSAYEKGGVDLVMDTIEINFGIQIEKYVMADFFAFIDIADTISEISSEVKELDLLQMNEFLNSFLPQITTNYKEAEILALLLKLPTYSEYEVDKLCIPIENTYETYHLQGVEVLGIDFNRNIDELYGRLYAF